MSLPLDDVAARHLARSGLETALIETGRDTFSSIEIDNGQAGAWRPNT